MRISEVIAKLEAIKKKHGDIPVDIYDRFAENKILQPEDEVCDVAFAGNFIDKDGKFHGRAYITNY